jgi:hypothetical protein
VIIKIGCYFLTSLNVKALEAVSHKNYKSFDSETSELTLFFPQRSTETVDLSEFVEFYTSHAGCGAYKVEAYKDSSFK